MALTKLNVRSISGDITADQLDVGQLGGRRNLIINGAMQVAQRGTSTASVSTTQYPSCDRWRFFTQTAATAVFTVSQDTDVPTSQGFAKSTKVDVTTAYAYGTASHYTFLNYRFEGQDVQGLKKGSSNAEQITVSFWVKSPKTGVHVVELEDADNSRYCSQAYTIATADTWENHTVTFPADTTGTLDNDNNHSLSLNFWLASGTNYTSGTLGTTWHTTATNRAAGQVNVVDNTANNFYLTGVQLEVGSVATPFEHRSYGESLALCQRYYQVGNMQGSSFVGSGGNAIAGNWSLPVEMRSTPTVNTLSTVPAYYNIFRPGTGNGCNSVPTTLNLSTTGSTVCLELTPSSGWQYTPAANDVWAGRNGVGTFSFDSEL